MIGVVSLFAALAVSAGQQGRRRSQELSGRLGLGGGQRVDPRPLMQRRWDWIRAHSPDEVVGILAQLWRVSDFSLDRADWAEAKVLNWMARRIKEWPGDLSGHDVMPGDLSTASYFVEGLAVELDAGELDDLEDMKYRLAEMLERHREQMEEVVHEDPESYSAGWMLIGEDPLLDIGRSFTVPSRGGVVVFLGKTESGCRVTVSERSHWGDLSCLRVDHSSIPETLRPLYEWAGGRGMVELAEELNEIDKTHDLDDVGYEGAEINDEDYDRVEEIVFEEAERLKDLVLSILYDHRRLRSERGELYEGRKLIADWLRANPDVDLSDLTIGGAIELAVDHHLDLMLEPYRPVGDEDVQGLSFRSPIPLGVVGDREVMRFTDGHRVVEITDVVGLRAEGVSMGHCIGSSLHGHPQRLAQQRVRVFSYRDENNKPHATWEAWVKDLSTADLQGKSDSELPGFARNRMAVFMDTAREMQMLALGRGRRLPVPSLPGDHRVAGISEGGIAFFREREVDWIDEDLGTPPWKRGD